MIIAKYGYSRSSFVVNIPAAYSKLSVVPSNKDGELAVVNGIGGATVD